ncbi:MAG TPA: AAA family ATPase, partial [Gaiellaceae bacterium]|nr:AAA family ATPase [Gaiellaceae bacterium]
MGRTLVPVGARAHGMQVLSAGGVQSEARLAYAGLHQVLRPVISLADTLPSRQRAALLTAFAMSDDAATEIFFIGLATLELLCEAAERAPILVIVEDAQWLDDASVSVLAFVARRLEAEKIVMLIVIRDGHETSFDETEFAELSVQALDEEAG